MHHLIVGGGPAGYTAAFTLAKLSPEDHVTLVSGEPHPYYSRVLTSYYIGDLISRDYLFLQENLEIGCPNVRLEMGCRMQSIDVVNRQGKLDNGRLVTYDRLLIATGALPKQPVLDGGTLPGVFVLRSLEDAERIRDWAGPGETAVIVGGGLVGLKTAEGLKSKGLKVKVVVSSRRILSQILDQEGADMFQHHLEDNGYQFLLGRDVQSIEGNDRVERIILNSGEKLACSLVIYAKGVAPETGFLKGTGIKTNRGILVDDRLQTNVSGVFAAGDVAETYDRLWKAYRVNALWGNAMEQGKAAAFNMAGKELFYPGSISINSIKMADLGVISGGIVNPPDSSFSVEKVRNEKEKTFRKLVLDKDGTLVGMVAIGFTKGTGVLLSLLGRHLKPARRKAFLQGSFDYGFFYKSICRGEI
ncbi:MAG: NAD(P)/FAD-dependent oxidoreductase [Clostridia bacterium]|nr:NAD(P)/FAD-dependent oxidoreductase [Clostridia bacterium]